MNCPSSSILTVGAALAITAGLLVMECLVRIVAIWASA